MFSVTTWKIRPLHHSLKNQGATFSWQLYSWKMMGCWETPLGRLALVSQRIALSFMRERVYLLALTPSFVKKSQSVEDEAEKHLMLPQVLKIGFSALKTVWMLAGAALDEGRARSQFAAAVPPHTHYPPASIFEDQVLIVFGTVLLLGILSFDEIIC